MWTGKAQTTAALTVCPDQLAMLTVARREILPNTHGNWADESFMKEEQDQLCPHLASNSTHVLPPGMILIY